MLPLSLLATAAALAPATATPVGHYGNLAILRVACLRTSEPCRGVVAVRERGRRLGAARFTVAAKRTRRVNVTLSRGLAKPLRVRLVVRMRGHRPRTRITTLLPHLRCGHGKPQLATPTTRVYLLKEYGYFACHRGGEPLELAEHSEMPVQTAERFTLAGEVLAYTVSVTWKGSSQGIYAVDLRTRRLLFYDLEPGPRWDCASDYGCRSGDVTDLAAAAAGWIAWSVRASPTTHEVRAQRPGGPPVILGGGPGVEPGSLEIAGDRATWTDGGERRSGTPG